MAKEILWQQGRTFGEFSLLTGHTKKDCVITNINLETKLAENLTLKIPLISAAMTSVTGYEKVLALGKEGGVGILPARLPEDEQSDIVKKIKNVEMLFVEKPVTARETDTIEQVFRRIEKHGHSKVPVTDRNNVFLGMFEQQEYWKRTDLTLQDSVLKAMTSLKSGVNYCNEPNITVDGAKKLLEKNGQNYLVVLDDQNRLVKLAFKKDVEEIKIGAAISTYKGWKERVKANVDAGVDLIVIDTSDAYNEFTANVIKEYKSMGIEVPICAGNVITKEGALYLMEAGADIIKEGMSPGSICTTQREKAVGRAPMASLLAADDARREYFEKTGRYVPIIADGGISSSADIIIALSIANAVMMGGYFNRFFEASADKLDETRSITTDESRMRWVETWGEGSERAQNLKRYGHLSRKTFFAEGIEGIVPYVGRLKPNVKKDLMKIRAALSNTGSMNLEEFRANAVLELNSLYSREIVGSSHNVEKKG